MLWLALLQRLVRGEGGGGGEAGVGVGEGEGEGEGGRERERERERFCIFTLRHCSLFALLLVPLPFTLAGRDSLDAIIAQRRRAKVCSIRG